MRSAKDCITAFPQQVIGTCVDKKMLLVELQICNWFGTRIKIQAVISVHQQVDSWILVHQLEEFKEEVNARVTPLRIF
jgi:hypothetical protein